MRVGVAAHLLDEGHLLGRRLGVWLEEACVEGAGAGAGEGAGAGAGEGEGRGTLMSGEGCLG